MRLFYQLFIKVYPLIIRLISPFNKKAQKWIIGRKESFSLLSDFTAKNTKPVIWMHTASLGEFEQGLPILERIKLSYPNYAIVVSFFSPSGYEVRKKHPIADLVCYLPMDSKANATAWLKVLKPTLVFFVKYEFWFYYLEALLKQKITCLLVAGIFRKEQVFFQWYGHFYRKILDCFSFMMVQDQDSLNLLSSIGLAHKSAIAGDPRFDRVISIADQSTEIPAISDFLNSSPALVCGSTWSKDDKAIATFAHQHQGYKYIIAPHDISAQRIKECVALYPNPILFTDWQIAGKIEKEKAQTLIINNMGMLSRIYQYATVAFVGGGFDTTGVHNTLEAAVYGVPVVFGPVYHKYLEAVELVAKGGAISVANPEELYDCFIDLFKNDRAKEVGFIAKNYVASNAGSVEKIVAYIQANRLLTN